MAPEYDHPSPWAKRKFYDNGSKLQFTNLLLPEFPRPLPLPRAWDAPTITLNGKDS